MRKTYLWAFCLCSLFVFTGCKSREKAYRQAYEQAMANDDNRQNEQQVVVVEKPEVTQEVTPVAPSVAPSKEDLSDVREIQGTMTVISGNPLKTFSVVVGSFVTQANAEGEQSRLQGKGYDARVVKTNETINGKTGWFRVVASSFDDKASAAQSRDALKGTYPGAWLLYRK